MANGAGSSRTRVAVLGASGRMGSMVCRVIEESSDLELVAAVDVRGGAPGNGTAQAVVSAGAQVAVDFTTPDAVMGNLETLVFGGVHAVVGTTGFDDARLDAVRRLLDGAPGVGVLVAPNFALGAVLMMHFARQAARF